LANPTVRTGIIPPLLVLAALFWFGRPRPLRLAVAVVVGLPVLTLLVCGAEPAWRVSGRVEDGARGARAASPARKKPHPRREPPSDGPGTGRQIPLR
jgi:hypothetical protein